MRNQSDLKVHLQACHSKPSLENPRLKSHRTGPAESALQIDYIPENNEHKTIEEIVSEVVNTTCDLSNIKDDAEVVLDSNPHALSKESSEDV